MRDEAVDPTRFDNRVQRYQQRALIDGNSWQERSAEMRAIDPTVTLHNHLAQEAIEAAQQGDYSVLNKLHQRLKAPYKQLDNDEYFTRPSTGWAEELEIPCSSYCGSALDT